MTDPKKIAALVVGGLPPPGKMKSKPPMGDDEGGGSDAAGVSAVKEFFEAGKSGDYAGAWSALQDAYKLADKDEPTDNAG